MEEYFVAIAGNIGAGKSTLTGMLAEHFGWQSFFEANAENPYLSDFYKDMERWSFHSQTFFLGKRLEDHRQLLDYPGSVVQDRTVYEDAEIFAENLYRQGKMSTRDYRTYRSLYEAINLFLPPPNLIIYLHASVDTLMRHINQRGREFEQNIERDYIAQLNGLYENWIGDWKACPILIVPMDKMNFQHNADHFAEIIQQIEDQLPQTVV